MILKVWGDWTLFQELLAVLRSIGNRHGGVSIANVATRWVLDQPAVGAVIIGECEISYHSPAVHPPSFPCHHNSVTFLFIYLPPYYVLRHHASIIQSIPSAYQRGLTDLTWTTITHSTRVVCVCVCVGCGVVGFYLSALSRRPHGNRRTQRRQQESVQLLFGCRRQCGHSSRFGKVERRQAHSDDR